MFASFASAMLVITTLNPSVKFNKFSYKALGLREITGKVYLSYSFNENVIDFPNNSWKKDELKAIIPLNE